ncbi:MAG TPA: ABC transporter permease [Thermoflexia bacterium]|nr:ABC transporter permease [Thermoflexia bacterium]
MRKLYALIRNEFLREFASPISLLFFIVLPLLFTAAVGTGLSGMTNDEEEEPQEYRPTLYVKQNDEGAVAAAFLTSLRATNLEPQVVDNLPGGEFGLEIPADFSAQLLTGQPVTLSLNIRPTNSTSLAVEQHVRAATGRVGGAALVAQAGMAQAREAGLVHTPAEEREFFQELLLDTLAASENPLAVAEINWAGGDVPQSQASNLPTSTEQASAGQLVTWVQITLLGAAEVLVNERLGGTLKRLLISPASRVTILGGKLVARLVLGLVQMTLLLVGGALLFGVEWGNAPLAVALVSVAFALATVGLGMLLATFIRTPSQASSAVVGLSMSLAALGGAWYPLEITPPLYRQLVQLLPSTWAMSAYIKLLARGATLAEVWTQIGVLLLFAAIFVAAGMWRFRDYE